MLAVPIRSAKLDIPRDRNLWRCSRLGGCSPCACSDLKALHVVLVEHLALGGAVSAAEGCLHERAPGPAQLSFSALGMPLQE